MIAKVHRDKRGFVLTLEHETNDEKEWVESWNESEERITDIREYDDGPMFSW